jgi:hypothetical protein
MKHISQTKTMACWYASAEMVVWWKRNATHSTNAAVWDPKEDPVSKTIWRSNTGLTNPQIVAFAQRLGLRQIPPQSPTPKLIKNWLMQYGPLWVNGKTHIVVIAGIKDEETADPKVLVYDPGFPSNNPMATQWRSLAGWYVGNMVDSRDTAGNVQTIFLYNP